MREAKAGIPVSIFAFLLAFLSLFAGSASPAAARAPSAAKRALALSSSDDSPAAPSITTQPSTQTVNPGQTATFTVVASGAAPLTYQWMRNGRAIAGATSPAYTTPAAAVGDNGAGFSVTIANAAGQTASATAALTVNPAAQSGQPAASASAQDRPVKTSRFLSNSYVGLQVGYIDYAFSNAQLQPGFQAQTVQVPHLAARVVLFGHEFNKYVSGQVSELIPAHGVDYQNVNGIPGNHYLWQDNIAGFTAKARLPLSKKWSLFGEGGLGVVTRNGFTINQATALKGANYATFLYGGGIDYRLNENWDFPTGVIVAPGQGKQPNTVFFAGGFNYTMRRVPEEPATTDSRNGPIWPKNFIQVGYITNALGYDVNDFFTKGKVPIFWHGTIEVRSGVVLDYQRNLFHTRRFFALDWGAAISTWKSRINGDRFYTVALYPVLRIPIVRTNPVEFYFNYSLGGPALITRTTIDNVPAGKVFTFQDFMGIGIYLGRKRRATAEVRIQHYSNANLFLANPGVTIPLGFYLGTTF
jgi:hypothetical protein